jgi:prepilin-type N-terminal cleavage/methylation domain-containing protein
MKKYGGNLTPAAGFTLIEILLAIGILAILATAAIIAINPARQFALARNTQRWSDVHALVNAVYQYSISHKGAFPPETPIPNTVVEFCQSDAYDCTGKVEMESLTTNATYLTAFPIDPSCPTSCSAYGTGYWLSINSDGRVVVQALNAELGEVIELTR